MRLNCRKTTRLFFHTWNVLKCPGQPTTLRMPYTWLESYDISVQRKICKSPEASSQWLVVTALWQRQLKVKTEQFKDRTVTKLKETISKLSKETLGICKLYFPILPRNSEFSSGFSCSLSYTHTLLLIVCLKQQINIQLLTQFKTRLLKASLPPFFLLPPLSLSPHFPSLQSKMTLT